MASRTKALRYERRVGALIADIHLWLSLLVALQMLVWMVSGLFMVSQPIRRVHETSMEDDVWPGSRGDDVSNSSLRR